MTYCVDCCRSQFLFDLTPEQVRRLRWRNLSPVVERRSQGGITIARHADGRFTVESEPTP